MQALDLYIKKEGTSALISLASSTVFIICCFAIILAVDILVYAFLNRNANHSLVTQESCIIY